MKAIFALFLFSALPAFAESTVSTGAVFDIQHQYLPDALSPAVGKDFVVLKGELNGSVKVDSYLFKLRPTGRWDPLNKSRDERTWWDVPEGFVQGKFSLGEKVGTTLRVGWDTFTWGVTDGFNPVDVINARRYNDPLRSEKFGAFSITNKYDFTFEDFSFLLEGIYIPIQRESRLPSDNSRWLPREIGGEIFTDNILFRPPTSPTYYYRQALEYDNALKHNYGVRLSSHLLGMDLAGYYFNGAATVPATSVRLTGTVTKINLGGSPEFEINANPAIGLRPLFHRIRMAGASLVFPLADLLFRFEGAITKDYKKDSSNIPEKITEAVGEIEHTFSFEKATLTTIGLFTYANYQEIPGTATYTPSLTRMFDRGAAFGLRWQPVPVWAGEGFVVFDTKAGGNLVKLDSTFTVSDVCKVFHSAEIFSGKTTTPIGVYRKNDRVFAGVRITL